MRFRRVGSVFCLFSLLLFSFHFLIVLNRVGKSSCNVHDLALFVCLEMEVYGRNTAISIHCDIDKDNKERKNTRTYVLYL